MQYLISGGRVREGIAEVADFGSEIAFPGDSRNVHVMLP